MSDDTHSDSERSGRGPAFRRLFARLALTLGLFAAALALLEGAARVIMGSEFVAGELRSKTWKVCGRYDPLMGWVNAPGVLARVRDGEIDYTLRINSSGSMSRAAICSASTAASRKSWVWVG